MPPIINNPFKAAYSDSFVRHIKLSSLGLDPDLNLWSKFSTHTIRHSLLFKNEINTLVSDSRLSPALETRRLLKESRQFSTDKPMFGLAESQQAKYK